MLLGQRFYRFQFYYDFTCNNEIGFEAFIEGSAFIKHSQLGLGGKRHPTSCKFTLKTFLVDFFAESSAEVVVNLEGRRHEIVAQLGQGLVWISVH